MTQNIASFLINFLYFQNVNYLENFIMDDVLCSTQYIISHLNENVFDVFSIKNAPELKNVHEYRDRNGYRNPHDYRNSLEYQNKKLADKRLREEAAKPKPAPQVKKEINYAELFMRIHCKEKLLQEQIDKALLNNKMYFLLGTIVGFVIGVALDVNFGIDSKYNHY